ncbi:MAG: hypothetical protein IKC32_07470 [Clostridia bacterium]|nr:hypothetical protein [Clostridia bacterium]
MSLFKENSYDIVKLYINQIGITIFSMFLYTAVPVEDDSLFKTLRILVSVFSILFYLVLVHNVMWEIGAKDKIRQDSGRYTIPRFKGGFIALFANIPNLVLALASVLFCSLYLGTGAEWCQSVFAIFFLIMRFHASMYMGLVQGASPASPGADAGSAIYVDALFESVWFLILPLVAVAITQLSYWLGTKEIKLLGFLSTKKPDDK